MNPAQKSKLIQFGIFGLILVVAACVIHLIVPPLLTNAPEGPIFIVEGEFAYQVHHLYIGIVVVFIGLLALRSRNAVGKIGAAIGLGVGLCLIWEDYRHHWIEGVPFDRIHPLDSPLVAHGILLYWNTVLAVIIALIGLLCIAVIGALGYDMGKKTGPLQKSFSHRDSLTAPTARVLRHVIFFGMGLIAIILLLRFWTHQPAFTGIILWGITFPQFLFLVGLAILIGIAVGNLIVPDRTMVTDTARKLRPFEPVILPVPEVFTSHFWIGGIMTIAILLGVVQELYFPEWGIEEAWDFWTFGHVVFGFCIAWIVLKAVLKKHYPPWIIIPTVMKVLTVWELAEYLLWRFAGYYLFLEGLPNRIIDIIAGTVGMGIYLVMATRKATRKTPPKPKTLHNFLPDLGHLLGAACLLGLILCGIIFVGEKLSVVPVLWLYSLVPGLTLAENVFALMIAVILAMFIGLWLITRITAVLVRPPRPDYTKKRFFAILIPEDSKRMKIVILALVIAYLISGLVYLFGFRRSPGDLLSISFLSFSIGVVTLIYDSDWLRAMIWSILPLVAVFYIYNLFIAFNGPALLTHLPHLGLAIYYVLRYRKTTWYHIAVAGLIWGTYFTIIGLVYPAFFPHGFLYNRPGETLGWLFGSTLLATLVVYLARKGATKALLLAKANIPAPDALLATAQQEWQAFITPLTPARTISAVRATSLPRVIPAIAEDGRNLYTPRNLTVRLMLQILVFTGIICGLVWIGATWKGGSGI